MGKNKKPEGKKGNGGGAGTNTKPRKKVSFAKKRVEAFAKDIMKLNKNKGKQLSLKIMNVRSAVFVKKVLDKVSDTRKGNQKTLNEINDFFK